MVDFTAYFTVPMLKPDGSACVRGARCDCECPEPQSGAALVSEECPVHNEVWAIPGPII